jgi:Trypsin-co-occurring domain 1
MINKLIKLQDGTLVEVESDPKDTQLISNSAAQKVDSSIDKIEAIIIKTCNPIMSAWQKLSNSVDIEQAEIELAFSFEAEGNLFITKGKAGANLTVKLTLKPQK